MAGGAWERVGRIGDVAGTLDGSAGGGCAASDWFVGVDADR